MRLAYNYTTNNFACYPPDSEGLVLSSNSLDADEDEVISPLIGNGDTFAIYDVSHWDGNDLAHFGSLHDGDKAGLMEGLTLIREGIYGIIGIQYRDTPLR